MKPTTFFVPGIPKPAGSKRGFIVRRAGGKLGVAITDDCKKGKDWRGDVKVYAGMAIKAPIVAGAVRLSVEFNMPRPKSHYRTGKHAGQLKPDAPTWHTSKPDRTKLVRGLEDALTGIAWTDDAQVVCGEVTKKYADREPGALVMIEAVK